MNEHLKVVKSEAKSVCSVCSSYGTVNCNFWCKTSLHRIVICGPSSHTGRLTRAWPVDFVWLCVREYGGFKLWANLFWLLPLVFVNNFWRFFFVYRKLRELYLEGSWLIWQLFSLNLSKRCFFLLSHFDWLAIITVHFSRIFFIILRHFCMKDSNNVLMA